MVKNCGGDYAKETISNIISGHRYTTHEDDMWTCDMPEPPLTPEILIMLPDLVKISAIRIWNYNRSVKDSIKGIK